MSGAWGLLAQGIQDTVNIGYNAFQTERANRQNEALTREGWLREDTAVFRRARDLKSAGINPLLAAGQAATTMQPARMEKAEGSIDVLAGIMADAQLKKNEADIKNINASTEHVKEQTAKVKEEAKDLRYGREAFIQNHDIGYKIKQQEYELQKKGLTAKDYENIILGVNAEFHRKGVQLDLNDKYVKYNLNRHLLEMTQWRDEQERTIGPAGAGGLLRPVFDSVKIIHELSRRLKNERENRK